MTAAQFPGMPVDLSAMHEIDFEKALVALAHVYGWSVASFRTAMTRDRHVTPVKYDGKGYPDLTLVHPRGRVVFAELKSQRGTLSDQQKRWRVRLEAIESTLCAALSDDTGDCAVMYRLWRPSDADEIAHVLSFGRMQPGHWRLTPKPRRK